MPHDPQTDLLCYRDRFYELADRPLDSYFKLIDSRPAFQRDEKGGNQYRAIWSIEEGWLFMTDVSGVWRDGMPLVMRDLFPLAGKKVFAAWWSGVLRGFRGDEALPSQANVVSCSPDLLINIEAGRVRASSIVHRQVRKAAPALVQVQPVTAAMKGQERPYQNAFVRV